MYTLEVPWESLKVSKFIEGMESSDYELMNEQEKTFAFNEMGKITTKFKYNEIFNHVLDMIIDYKNNFNVTKFNSNMEKLVYDYLEKI